MNNKQLAEMIKILRKKKIEEVIGKPGPFKPVHLNTKDSSSPNEYFHRMKEEKLNELGPTYIASQDKQAGIASKMPSDRKRYQHGNQERSPSNYTAEENKKEVELGSTDTNQSGETISVNPKDNTSSAKGGEMNKNSTTIKEIKEKKNATLG